MMTSNLKESYPEQSECCGIMNEAYLDRHHVGQPKDAGKFIAAEQNKSLLPA
jgi:hypothetical protein